MISRFPLRYELIASIGSGRFATVYHAWDRELQRDVALKITDTVARSEQEITRIRRESRISCRLRHPSIVSGFDAFTHETFEVLCLPQISGGTLLDSDAKKSVSIRLKLERIIKVTEAVVYLHSRGLVHGDIKPENILLDDQGRPYLADFGSCQLVKSPDAEVVGTPAYLAPEIVCGKSPATLASDVYALGATLYETLSGRPPFTGEAHAVLDQIRTQVFPVASKANPRLDGSLDAIIKKACAGEPALRYASATELGSDLANYLENRPLVARKTSIGGVALLWSQRNPMIASLSAALVAIVVFGTVIATMGWTRSLSNQHSVTESEKTLREKANIATLRESTLQTLLVSIEREQATIDLASRNEKELTYQAESARIEIDSKSKTASEQVLEAERLNALASDMKLEEERLGSAVNLANSAVAQRIAFAGTVTQRRDDMASLQKAMNSLKKVMSHSESNPFSQSIYKELRGVLSSVPQQWRGLAWATVTRAVTLALPQHSETTLELPNDVIRVITDRAYHRLLFFRSSQFAELEFLNSESKWSTVVLNFRRIAGIPPIHGTATLGCFSADGTSSVLWFPSTTGAHELLVVSTSGDAIGSLQSRVKVQFDGDVHAIRYLDSRRIYLLRSNRTSGDLELYSVFENKTLWSCRAHRAAEKENVLPLLPFFIECGTDSWQHLLFASSMKPTSDDAKTHVFLHSVDLRKTPEVRSLDCGEQELAQWPHQWQLSPHHILGVGRQSLSTVDPPAINHPRFDTRTTLDQQQIQALTQQWSPISLASESQTPGSFLESELYLPRENFKGRLKEGLEFAPILDRVAGKLLYAQQRTLFFYDVINRNSVSLPLNIYQARHVIPLSGGRTLLLFDKTKLRIVQLADWDADSVVSVDAVNDQLLEVERRFQLQSDSSVIVDGAERMKDTTDVSAPEKVETPTSDPSSNSSPKPTQAPVTD